MNKLTIYIDESGTLPDKNDACIVVAAVAIQLPQLLENILKKTRKKLKTTERALELKFYHAGNRTKKVNVADMVAGATLAKLRGKDQFYKLFEQKITSEIKVKWPEVKRRFIDYR